MSLWQVMQITNSTTQHDTHNTVAGTCTAIIEKVALYHLKFLIPFFPPETLSSIPNREASFLYYS